MFEIKRMKTPNPTGEKHTISTFVDQGPYCDSQPARRRSLKSGWHPA